MRAHDVSTGATASLRAWAFVALLVAAAIGGSTQPAARAASSSGSVVGATVPSATSLDVSGCASGVPGKTDFGIVAPGSTAVTNLDCDVAFGSSNDTAKLRMRQGDGAGSAMWMRTTGSLDQAFDGPTGTANGIIVDARSPASSDIGTDVLVQPDGKVVVSGHCDMGSNNDFCLARYNADGSRDVTFDGPSGTGNGRFIDAIGVGNDSAVALALQPDGKLVVAGSCELGGWWRFCVARYNPDGSRDVTWDGPSGTANGAFIEPIGASNDWLAGAEVLADGDVLVAGSCSNGANDDVCMARFNPDGSRDLAFDGPSGSGNGEVLDPIGVGNDQMHALAIQADGRVVVAGSCANGAANNFCAGRYETDGRRDLSFDGPGGSGNGVIIVPATANYDVVNAVLVQQDGRLVLAGGCMPGAVYQFCLERLNVNGTLDATFDGPSGTGNGVFSVGVGPGDANPRSATIQDDGRAVLVGECWNGSSLDYCFARFNADGSWDTSFDGPGSAGDGRFLIPIGPTNDTAYAATPLPDGELVVTGECWGTLSSTWDTCTVKFGSGGRFDDYVTGGGSDRDFAAAATTSFFATCLRAVSGGASATWSTASGCSAVDGVDWHAVPVAATQVAYTTALEPDPVDATARLRFALRPATSQPPGTYVAPVTFDVVAP